MKYCFLFLLVLCTCRFGFAQNADINLLRSISENECRTANRIFLATSNSATPVSLATPLAVLIAGKLTKDTALQYHAYYIGASVLIASALATGLKYSINRERPFDHYPFIRKKTEAGSPSFPSGHTSAAFATATSLSLACPEWYVIAPAFLWAGTVAYSRMYLGVHYPSDVAGGIITGAGTALLTWKCRKWLDRRKDNKSH